MKDLKYGGEKCILYWYTILAKMILVGNDGHMYSRYARST